MNIEEKKKTNKEKEEEEKQKIRNDLIARFLVNLPPSEISDWNRLLYQALLASWWYTDHYTTPTVCKTDGTKKRRNRKRKGQPADDSDVKELYKFSQWFFTSPHTPSYEQVRSFFYDYYYLIPVCGVIAIDRVHSKWLLVRGNKSQNFSFPRGKKNRDEPDVACALRETKEETGYDLTQYINPEKSVEVWNKGKKLRLYLAEVDSEKNPIQATGNGTEISEVRWMVIPNYASSDTMNQIHRMFRDTYTFETRLALLKIRRWL